MRRYPRRPCLNGIRLTIESSLSKLFAVSVLVRGICEHLKTDSAVAHAVELCAVEAVSNAIRHAYGCVPGNEVILDINFTSDRLDLFVRDHGVTMPDHQIHRLKSASPTFGFDPRRIDTVPEGGMGLDIIRQEMDGVSYRTEDGYNCLQLTQFLVPPQNAESSLSKS